MPALLEVLELPLVDVPAADTLEPELLELDVVADLRLAVEIANLDDDVKVEEEEGKGEVLEPIDEDGETLAVEADALEIVEIGSTVLELLMTSGPV
ncbi:hypothetical protein MMC28_000122 [Mycoblastus sanguinarius]|nr:hypothetical protein [Mycoblastus sanguinarius]